MVDESAVHNQEHTDPNVICPDLTNAVFVGDAASQRDKVRRLLRPETSRV
jgi:hypothetical protein